MLAFVALGTNKTERIDMPFEDFLGSEYFSRRAKAAFSTPEDLVLDHLPSFDDEDEDETCEAFGEACEQATDGDATAIRFDREDLRFVRSRLIRRQFALMPCPQPPEAA